MSSYQFVQWPDERKTLNESGNFRLKKNGFKTFTVNGSCFCSQHPIKTCILPIAAAMPLRARLPCLGAVSGSLELIPYRICRFLLCLVHLVHELFTGYWNLATFTSPGGRDREERVYWNVGPMIFWYVSATVLVREREPQDKSISLGSLVFFCFFELFGVGVWPPCFKIPVLISHLVIYQLRHVFISKAYKSMHVHITTVLRNIWWVKGCSCLVASCCNLLTWECMHINLILTYDRKRYNLLWDSITGCTNRQLSWTVWGKHEGAAKIILLERP